MRSVVQIIGTPPRANGGERHLEPAKPPSHVRDGGYAELAAARKESPQVTHLGRMLASWSRLPKPPTAATALPPGLT
jgi:hypothetical protein